MKRNRKILSRVEGEEKKQKSEDRFLRLMQQIKDAFKMGKTAKKQQSEQKRFFR